MTQRVAILGLGTMGMGMAKNLLKADFAVAVHNRTSAKAARSAYWERALQATPADAARDADVVISMLSDDDASRQTWTGEDGALKSARPGTVLVESSTVTPAWISELELLAAERTAPSDRRPRHWQSPTGGEWPAHFSRWCRSGYLGASSAGAFVNEQRHCSAWSGGQRCAHEAHQQFSCRRPSRRLRGGHGVGRAERA